MSAARASSYVVIAVHNVAKCVRCKDMLANVSTRACAHTCLPRATLLDVLGARLKKTRGKLLCAKQVLQLHNRLLLLAQRLEHGRHPADRLDFVANDHAPRFSFGRVHFRRHFIMEGVSTTSQRQKQSQHHHNVLPSSSSSLLQTLSTPTSMSVTGKEIEDSRSQFAYNHFSIDPLRLLFSPTNGKLHVNTSMKFGKKYGCGVQLNWRIFITLFSYLSTAALLL